jgi:uncharacterized protein (TIGR02466 family)
MIDNAIVVPIFPVALYKSKVNYKLSVKENNFIKNGKYTEGSHRTFSDYNYNYLDNPVFSKLKQRLQLHVNNYVKNVFKYDAEIYITKSWLNINPPGSSHSMHRHVNSVFSGVYYIKLPVGTPFLIFSSPIPQMFHFIPTEWNDYNCHSWTVNLEKDDLVIFPSTLYHEVSQNFAKEDRICIAFNTFVRGYVGDKGLNHSGVSDSTYQIIK